VACRRLRLCQAFAPNTVSFLTVSLFKTTGPSRSCYFPPNSWRLFHSLLRPSAGNTTDVRFVPRADMATSPCDGPEENAFAAQAGAALVPKERGPDLIAPVKVPDVGANSFTVKIL